VVADPRALAARSADPVLRTLAQLAQGVTEAPWSLGPADRARAHAAGLPDETIVHVVLLSSLFGHLNRVADAVGIELDYSVAIVPPHAEPATPSYLRPAPAEWPEATARHPLPLRISESLAAWRAHALEREAPLDRHQRAVLAHAVAERLGDAATVWATAIAPTSRLDEALVAAADEVTLAPWRLGADTVSALRQAGLVTDAAIFDALATAAACTTFSRIRVALAALGA
jgi:alkylhydroperoxidase family enzyme